jgi:hypothetical protein
VSHSRHTHRLGTEVTRSRCFCCRYAALSSVDLRAARKRRANPKSASICNFDP